MAPSRPSVLVVDGDEVARRALVRLLQPVAVVADVDSAECALRAIATGTVFDAVVMADVRRAAAASKKIRAAHPELVGRVLVLSRAEGASPEVIRELVLAVAGSADVAAE
ncbi:MAG: hypothetical protein JWP87_4347 [Labilithrix sp.]|jgi:CheY-like chemotaxis protein|nr:hypothetical protein [Labilithrix sp.]